MTNKEKRIRNLALCLFSNKGRVLGAKGIDRKKSEIFYRPFGGGIEFGESGIEAIEREIREELGQEITGVRLLGVVENLFEFDGQTGHEIVFVFDAQFCDHSLYSNSILEGIEESKKSVLEGHWIDIDAVLSKTIKLYPAKIVPLLKQPSN